MSTVPVSVGAPLKHTLQVATATLKRADAELPSANKRLTMVFTREHVERFRELVKNALVAIWKFEVVQDRAIVLVLGQRKVQQKLMAQHQALAGKEQHISYQHRQFVASQHGTSAAASSVLISSPRSPRGLKPVGSKASGLEADYYAAARISPRPAPAPVSHHGSRRSFPTEYGAAPGGNGYPPSTPGSFRGDYSRAEHKRSEGDYYDGSVDSSMMPRVSAVAAVRSSARMEAMESQHKSGSSRSVSGSAEYASNGAYPSPMRPAGRPSYDRRGNSSGGSGRSLLGPMPSSGEHPSPNIKIGRQAVMDST